MIFKYKLYLKNLVMYFYEANKNKDEAVVLNLTDMDSNFINIRFGDIEYKFPSEHVKNRDDKNYYIINELGIYLHFNGDIYFIHFYENGAKNGKGDYYPISKDKVEYRDNEYYLK